jgi:hypothetical protein
MIIAPSSIINDTSLLARWPLNPPESSAARKTDRVKIHIVARVSPVVEVYELMLSIMNGRYNWTRNRDDAIMQHTSKEEFEFLRGINVGMGWVQMISVLVHSQCKFSADDCKSCETRNLDGETSDHDMGAEINLR